MIVVDTSLWSAIDHSVTRLGLLIIDNVGTYNNGNTADYRVRVWRKGVSIDDIKRGAKPFREGHVIGHARKSRPIWSLVARALDVLNYD
jgi:hypothetical protein